MIKQIIILLGFLGASLLPALAQQEEIIDPMPVRLNGKVINADDGEPIPYAHIVNLRRQGGTITNLRGEFTLEILNIDSLAISAVGFVRTSLRLPRNYREGEALIIELKPVRYALGEVKVTNEKVNMHGIPQGKQPDIPIELRGSAFNRRPPLLAAIFNPLSFMQYHLSGSEREKRAVREAIITEQQWERLSQWYNKETVMELTGLDNEEADRFMIYFNQKGVLYPHANAYDVREAILVQFRLYLEEKNEDTGDSSP